MEMFVVMEMEAGPVLKGANTLPEILAYQVLHLTALMKGPSPPAERNEHSDSLHLKIVRGHYK